MTAIHISDVIALIPASKLTTSSVCNEETEFDVALAWQQIWTQPLDFPTLDQAILQEDTVCIPVEPGIPNEAQIAAGVAKSIREIGVDQDQITILLPEGATSNRLEDYRIELDRAGCSGCDIQVHDASQPESQGYLGPSESGEPISLNARLVHADFVLPVSRAKACGWKCDLDFLYPYFSDRESQKRFFKLNLENRVRLNQEVHRWLGNCTQVSVAARTESLPNEQAGVTIGTALLGETGSVNRAMHDYFRHQASEGSESQFDLVIARLNSHLCLSREEVFDWAENLLELCSPGGSAVILWDDANQIPRLVEFEDQNELEDHNQNSSDLAGKDFGNQRCFISTDQPLLNQVGISPINELRELKQLVERSESVLVISDFINDFAYHRDLKINPIK